MTKVYMKTSRTIKRLERLNTSPVLTHLSSTLNGLTTIRAYNAQEILKLEFDRFQDQHSSAWYMSTVINNAFGFSTDFFCFVFTTIVTFGLVLASGYSGSAVGLAITTVLSMTGLIQWGIRQSAEVGNQMISVERILEYTSLPPEDNLDATEIPKIRNRKRAQMTAKKEKLGVVVISAPQNWPSMEASGSIKFT